MDTEAFKQSSFEDSLNNDIDKVKNNLGAGNESNRIMIFTALHRLRRLHYLYAQRNLYRDIDSAASDLSPNFQAPSSEVSG